MLLHSKDLEEKGQVFDLGRRLWDKKIYKMIFEVPVSHPI